MKNINTRLQEMTNKLNSKELFESNNLGNEINFHVFDYEPKYEYVVRDYLDNYLLKKSKLNIKVFDIYNITGSFPSFEINFKSQKLSFIQVRLLTRFLIVQI